jgi:hypothetical protein
MLTAKRVNVGAFRDADEGRWLEKARFLLRFRNVGFIYRERMPTAGVYPRVLICKRHLFKAR